MVMLLMRHYWDFKVVLIDPGHVKVEQLDRPCLVLSEDVLKDGSLPPSLRGDKPPSLGQNRKNVSTLCVVTLATAANFLFSCFTIMMCDINLCG